VTLRSSVGSFRQRRAAVKIAESVRGVSAVQDELWVDPRDRWEDNEIRGAALQALMSSDGIPADQIDVTVAEGWLTLRGVATSSPRQRDPLLSRKPHNAARR